jgi:NAD(P)-dependent dehydrogenase (short-subunit alcohol dehydrogenase family)
LHPFNRHLLLTLRNPAVDGVAPAWGRRSERIQVASLVRGQSRSGVALITGCSSGIGRATAATFASAGYQVVATARQAESLAGLDVAMALRVDVTDATSIEAAVETVLQRYGRIDVLVNNEGYALRGAVEEVDVLAVARMFDTNVSGSCAWFSLSRQSCAGNTLAES